MTTAPNSLHYVAETNGVGEINYVGSLELPADLTPTDAEYKRLVDWKRLKRFNLGDTSEYRAFMDWMGSLQLPVVPGKLPPTGLVFFSVETLVGYCKWSGTMLFALGGALHLPNSWRQPGLKPFHALAQSWAPRGATWDQHVDGIGWFLRNDLWIPDSVVVDVKNMIPDEDREARRITSLPITRTFVCLDVSDFSKYTPGEEALIINSIVSILSQEHNWRNAGSVVRTAHEAMMCIGDGYIFVFREAIKGAYFAAYVAQLIEALVARRKLPVDFHFRIGVHVGEVYSFWDPGRQDWNYIGEGINGGNRVLSAIDKGYDDQVFVSGDVRKAIMASPDADFEYKKLLANLHNRGRRPDKHGRPWRVYELNHTAFCAGDLPLDLGGE